MPGSSRARSPVTDTRPVRVYSSSTPGRAVAGESPSSATSTGATSTGAGVHWAVVVLLLGRASVNPTGRTASRVTGCAVVAVEAMVAVTWSPVRVASTSVSPGAGLASR